MEKLLVVLIALTFTMPFKDWIEMDTDTQVMLIDALHQKFHIENPKCIISSCLGIPRKEVRRFRRDRKWIDFTVECAKWVKEFSVKEVSSDCI